MYPNSILAWLVSLVCAYLLGSVSGGIVASHLRHHEDLRDYGSGNAGMTNALRTYGIRNAALVAAIDLLKTILAILLASWLIGRYWGLMVGSAAATLGHLYPVYYQFRGGKGVLCGLASLIMVDWRLGILVVAVFALMMVLTRRASVGSICACASSPFFCWMLGVNTVHIIFVVVIASLLIWMHRSNIKRLLRGEEGKTVVAKRRKP